MKKSTQTFTIDTDPDTYWKTFLDDGYSTAVYLDGLGYESAQILDKDGDVGSGLTRKLETVQELAAPGPIKKLMGDTTTNVEDGEFDADAKVWSFTITPDKMSDKLHVSGKVTAQARDDGKTDQVVEMSFEAKVRLIGGMFEGFMESQSNGSWVKAADFLNSWIADKGLGSD